MRRWFLVWLWVLAWAGAGCSRPIQQSIIETAVVATLTARPAATATAFRLSVTPWPTPSRAAAAPAAATTALPVRPAATATPQPPARTSAGLRAGCLSWSEAKAYEGQTQCVCGPVVDATYAARSNGAPTFLNLGGRHPDPNRFTVVIWGDQRPNFDPPPEQAYLGKTICVTGRIKIYKGVAEIQISSPAEVTTE